MKKRTQGEAPRIAPCPEGGEHVLMRPVQLYCDRCRPKRRQQTLERQRHWRERERAKKSGGAPPVSAAPPVRAIAPTPPLEHQILQTVATLLEQTQRLDRQYRVDAEATSEQYDQVRRLVRDALNIDDTARFLRPAEEANTAGVPDELAGRRGRRSR